MTELEEEHGGDEGAFAELEKVNKANVSAWVKELKVEEELAVLEGWLRLSNRLAKVKQEIKAAAAGARPGELPRGLGALADVPIAAIMIGKACATRPGDNVCWADWGHHDSLHEPTITARTSGPLNHSSVHRLDCRRVLPESNNVSAWQSNTSAQY